MSGVIEVSRTPKIRGKWPYRHPLVRSYRHPTIQSYSAPVVLGTCLSDLKSKSKYNHEIYEYYGYSRIPHVEIYEYLS